MPAAQAQGKQCLYIDLAEYGGEKPDPGRRMREAFKRRHDGWKTIPMIFVNNKFIGGGSDAKELEEKGELKFG